MASTIPNRALEQLREHITITQVRTRVDTYGSPERTFVDGPIKWTASCLPCGWTGEGHGPAPVDAILADHNHCAAEAVTPAEVELDDVGEARTVTIPGASMAETVVGLARAARAFRDFGL